MKFRVELVLLSDVWNELESPVGCDSHPYHFEIVQPPLEGADPMLLIVWCVTPPPFETPPANRRAAKRKSKRKAKR